MKELSLLCVVLFTYSTSCLGQACVLRLVLINVSLNVSMRVPKCIPFGYRLDWLDCSSCSCACTGMHRNCPLLGVR